jgi:hypothetical protein
VPETPWWRLLGVVTNAIACTEQFAKRRVTDRGRVCQRGLGARVGSARSGGCAILTPVCRTVHRLRVSDPERKRVLAQQLLLRSRNGNVKRTLSSATSASLGAASMEYWGRV